MKNLVKLVGVKKLVVVFVSLAFVGCTSIQVKPIAPSKLGQVCIHYNTSVKITEFVGVLEAGFKRHGLTTYVVMSPDLHQCDNVVTYSAERTWDFSWYLSHAEIFIAKDGVNVASAIYHLKNKGGLSLSKWASVEEKMNPVIDELLQGKPVN